MSKVPHDIKQEIIHMLNIIQHNRNISSKEKEKILSNLGFNKNMKKLVG